jgi:hypothetical protein
VARVRALRQAQRLSESKAAFDAYRHRTFQCHVDDAGSLVFEGRLPAEQGALLLQALDRAMDWLFAGQPHRPRLRRDDARIEDMPHEVRRADALAILAEQFLSEPPAADAGLSTSDRYQLSVHASAEALIEYGDVDPDDPPHIEHGAVIAAEPSVESPATVLSFASSRAATANRSTSDARRASSPPPYIAHCDAAIAVVDFPVAPTPASSTHTTSGTGPTAVRRASTT